MTKKQKQAIIREAIRLVESDEVEHSCTAIQRAQFNFLAPIRPFDFLTNSYVEMFGQGPNGQRILWISDVEKACGKDPKGFRILMLWFFHEVVQ